MKSNDNTNLNPENPLSGQNTETQNNLPKKPKGNSILMRLSQKKKDQKKETKKEELKQDKDTSMNNKVNNENSLNKENNKENKLNKENKENNQINENKENNENQEKNLEEGYSENTLDDFYGIKKRSKSVKIVFPKKKANDIVKPVSRNDLSYLKTPKVNAPKLSLLKHRKPVPKLSLGSSTISTRKKNELNPLGIIKEEENASDGEKNSESELSSSSSDKSDSSSYEEDSSSDTYYEIEEIDEYEEIEIEVDDDKKNEIPKIQSSSESDEDIEENNNNNENNNKNIIKNDEEEEKNQENSILNNLRNARRKMTSEKKSFHIKRNLNAFDLIDRAKNESMNKIKEDLFKDKEEEKTPINCIKTPQVNFKKTSILSTLAKKKGLKI